MAATTATAASNPSTSSKPPVDKMSLLKRMTSGFLDTKKDLMNDWEIGGTQNRWVCPSDRHLQLRAQLKSGWSNRTATARSPTNATKNANSNITEAEAEHIRQVLAKAEASRQHEQQRLGKMVDRLEKMKRRATGNGVTHCVLCHTEFGLLASKSYAAMCSDCRKYVCQRNCGVETLDQRTGEVAFLCKICSEAREVLWKKSGAWFYKELPSFQRPELPIFTNGTTATPPANGKPSWSETGNGAGPSNGSLRRHLPATPAQDRRRPSPIPELNSMSSANDQSSPLPLPDIIRSKSPRPKIQPSWVKEKVMSSMSVDDDDRSSSDGEYSTPAAARRNQTATSAATRREMNLARFAMESARITDSEDESSPESHATTRSSSPRRSLATPSSYDSSHNPNAAQTTAGHNDDARSIDSGVVQSDHSNQQAPLTLSVSSLTPFSAASTAEVVSPRRIGAGQTDSNMHSPARMAPSTSGTMIVSPPPIPPRNSGLDAPSRTSPAPSLGNQSRHTSSSSLSSAAATRVKGGQANTLSIENLGSITERVSATPLSTAQNESPAFMSSPDDDLKSRQQQRRAMGGPRRMTSLGSSSASSSVPDARPTSSPAEPVAPKSPPPPPTPQATTADAVFEAFSDVNGASDAKETTETQTAEESGAEQKKSSSSSSSPSHRMSLLSCFHNLVSSNRSTLGSIQFSCVYSQADKSLTVVLIRAKNLKAMDSNGFSDPYVKLHLLPGNTKATKLTSKTIEKTLNPEWNETLIYHGVTDEDRLKKTLRITVLDRDRIGSDFLGETRVALKKLPLNQMKKFNLYLEHAIPIPQQKQEETAERGKILVGLQYNIQQGSLYVSIKRCAELVGMDSTGFSDPYCKVSLTPVTNKAHRLRTSIKKRTLNPEFAETLAFVVPFKDLPKKTLQIGVYDHDLGKHDDYIGGILLSTAAKDERGKQWINCIENPGQCYEAWHKLELD